MEKREKKNKINWKRTFKNNKYMLDFIIKVSPGILILEFISTVLMAISTFFTTTYLYKYAFDALQKGESIKNIVIFLVGFFAFSIFSKVFGHICDSYIQINFPKVEAHIQNILHKKAATVDLACFENTEFYDTYVKAVDEAGQRVMAVKNSIMDIVWAFVYGASILTVVFTIDPIFILIALIPLLFTVFIGKRRNRVQYEYDIKNKEIARQRDYVRRTFYLKDYSKEMRLTNIHTVMLKRMRKSITEMKLLVKKYGYKMMFFRYLFDLLFQVVVRTGSIILAVYKTLVSKTMLIGGCYVVVNSIESLADNFNYIVGTVLKLDENSLYIDNLRDFLEYEIKIAEDKNAPEIKKFRSLEINNLSFNYGNDTSYVLNNISLNIKAGEKIAFVGYNGAGKTTLIKLLQRLYDPSAGEIKINGENIKNIRLSSYRALFGTVFQDYQLFATTVAENVTLGDDKTNEKKDIVENSLKKAGIYDKIQRLPNGMDTIVTKEFDENGAVFSGGEAQKISISRIFAGDNEIVIMDEPTSALDPIAEQEMYNNMFEACEGKTVIFISHRLSSTVMADKIYMLENGKIAEQGTHNELLKLNGKYADMWHKQADNYTR